MLAGCHVRASFLCSKSSLCMQACLSACAGLHRLSCDVMAGGGLWVGLVRVVWCIMLGWESWWLKLLLRAVMHVCPPSSDAGSCQSQQDQVRTLWQEHPSSAPHRSLGLSWQDPKRSLSIFILFISHAVAGCILAALANCLHV